MKEIELAIQKLKATNVVAIPTETVYGLAAIITDELAISKIFKTKERPFFDPLIVHVKDAEMAKTLTLKWPVIADVLTEAFWPGPLTIILPKNDKVSDLITSGLDKVGLRCPKHSMAQEIITQLGIPLAAPSANKFKKTSPTNAQHVRDEFGEEVMVLDGGDCEIGIESTIVELDQDKVFIYRPGMITKSDIEKTLELNGLDVEVVHATSPVAPGQLKHHYMPKIPLFLLESEQQIRLVHEDYQINVDELALWHANPDARLFARELYAKLREYSQTGAKAICLVLDKNIIQNENWLGILNRLQKAKTKSYLKD